MKKIVARMRVRHITLGMGGRVVEVNHNGRSHVRWDKTGFDWLNTDELRPERFGEFLLNDGRHGKWSLWEGILVHLFGLIALIVGVATGVWYISIPFFLAFEGLIFWGHWRNFNDRQA